MQFILYPAASVIFYALTAFIPQVGMVAAIFSPLLILLYLADEKRSRLTDGLFALFVAGLGVLSPVLSGFYLLSALVPALFIRMHINSGKKESWIPSAASPIFIFIAVAAAVFVMSDYRASLVEMAEQALKMFMDAVRQTKNPIADDPYFIRIYENPKEAALAIVMIFPAFNYIFTAFSAHISQGLFLKLRRMPVTPFRLPDNAVWILILGFTFLFIKHLYIRYAGMNISLVMLTLYSFQGFEIINYWLLKLRVFPVIRALIFIFIFTEPPVIIVIALLGLFSVWFNLYGRRDDHQEQTPSDSQS